MSLTDLETLYRQLREDAKAKGQAHGQVWHEADIDGYHLYMADTSFGDGPLFSLSGPARRINGPRYWAFAYGRGTWPPVGKSTKPNDLRWILPLAERAEWEYRLTKLDPLEGP